MELLAFSPTCSSLRPSPAPMVLVLQPQRPLGTLTVCWSRQDWQVYSKLANWQYLVGPQSSSMMHSWGEGGSSFISRRQSSTPTAPRKGKAPFYPRPHRLRMLQKGVQTPLTPELAPAPQHPHAPGEAEPSPTQRARPSALQDAAPVRTMASVCSPPPHIQGGSTETGQSPCRADGFNKRANEFQPRGGCTGGAGAQAAAHAKGAAEGSLWPPSSKAWVWVCLAKAAAGFQRKEGCGCMGAATQLPSHGCLPIRLEKWGREGGHGRGLVLEESPYGKPAISCWGAGPLASESLHL